MSQGFRLRTTQRKLVKKVTVQTTRILTQTMSQQLQTKHIKVFKQLTDYEIQ